MVKTKRAIAMIELIFALVIIGIALMSAPMLIQQSIKSSNIALQQEAISAAASQVAIVLSMHWDEANANIPAGASPILDTNRSGYIFPLVGLTNLTGRNIDENNTLNPTPISSLGPDTNESSYIDFDDVDDYNNQSFGLMLFNNESTSSDIGEYIDTNISIRTTVRYTKESNVLEDINSTISPYSNIKAIKVNLTSNSGVAELDKNITFQAFSCNIGTYSIKGKKL